MYEYRIRYLTGGPGTLPADPPADAVYTWRGIPLTEDTATRMATLLTKAGYKVQVESRIITPWEAE